MPEELRKPYRVCVYRARDTESLGQIYHMPLRKRLPTIAVPLRQADEDVPLDLQALIDLCYQNGGYDEDLNYQAEPSPPLAPDDARWAEVRLRKQGRRARATSRKPSHRKGQTKRSHKK
jgi:Protein of unknown function (DUF4058)